MPQPHQAAAIPFRRRDRNVSVCLITASTSRAWTFPKGLIDEGFTAEETALQEAWEEAGLRGALVGASLGTYTYEKWGKRLSVAVYLMEVESVATEWDEQDVRDRRWVPADELVDVLDRHPARHLVSAAVERLRARPRAR